jgi:hypothetical protein
MTAACPAVDGRIQHDRDYGSGYQSIPAYIVDQSEFTSQRAKDKAECADLREHRTNWNVRRDGFAEGGHRKQRREQLYDHNHRQHQGDRQRSLDQTLGIEQHTD